ncbi:flavodoxin family protein [Chloroflexota bacterium]
MPEILKVAGFSCSPRRGGNTDIMVQRVMEAAGQAGADVELIRVADMMIMPCDGCLSCTETGRCHIEDDMQRLYLKLLQADGIVIGSPVYMGHSICGQAQVFIDRTFLLWHERRLQNKVGVGVIASIRRGGISGTRVINSLFLGHNMIVAGSASGLGNNPGDILNDAKALNDASAAGRRLYEIMRIMNHGLG